MSLASVTGEPDLLHVKILDCRTDATMLSAMTSDTSCPCVIIIYSIEEFHRLRGDGWRMRKAHVDVSAFEMNTCNVGKRVILNHPAPAVSQRVG
jgi:hypothetical protein